MMTMSGIATITDQKKMFSHPVRSTRMTVYINFYPLLAKKKGGREDNAASHTACRIGVSAVCPSKLTNTRPLPLSVIISRDVKQEQCKQ